jgi:hypothetical protein
VILVDNEYEAAYRRAAQQGKELVLQRFIDVYGKDQGTRVFNSMVARMETNISRDARVADEGASPYGYALGRVT